MNRSISMMVLLCFLFFYVQIHSEGFGAGTIVKTPNRYIKIEDISMGDQIISFDEHNDYVKDEVIYIAQQSIDCYIRIKIDNEYFSVACDQRLYDNKNNSWIIAATLKNGDILSGNPIATELIQDPIDVYIIGTAKYHNFFITTYDICVHNFVPIVLAISAAFGSGAIEIISISAGIAALGAFFCYKWSNKNKQKYIITISPQFYGGEMMPEDPEEEKKKKRDEARKQHRPLTNQEARIEAKKLGYRETKNHPCGHTYDKPVFTNGKQFISPDKYGHKGGVWKIFNKIGKRIATVNIDLTKTIGT